MYKLYTFLLFLNYPSDRNVYIVRILYIVDRSRVIYVNRFFFFLFLDRLEANVSTKLVPMCMRTRTRTATAFSPQKCITHDTTA